MLITDDQQAAVLEGNPELEWEGALELIRRQYHETDSDTVRRTLHEYMTARACSECEGGRLRAASRAVTVDGHRLTEVVELSVGEALDLFEGLRAGEAAMTLLGPDPYFDDLFCMAAKRAFMSCERSVDAETLVIALGSVNGTIKDVVDQLRDEGIEADTRGPSAE